MTGRSPIVVRADDNNAMGAHEVLIAMRVVDLVARIGNHVVNGKPARR